MKNKLKLVMLIVMISLSGMAQDKAKKAVFSYELNNYFVSESNAFDLKKESNPVAFLKNTVAPTIDFDYFLRDKGRLAISIGLSQSVYFNSLNNDKLNEFAKTVAQGEPYRLDWQGGSPKVQFGTMLGVKFWIPSGKGGVLFFEPRAGIRYGGSSGLNINVSDTQNPVTMFKYEAKTTVPIWEIRANYSVSVGKVALGLSGGYGSNGVMGGVRIKLKRPPYIWGE
jgi:hypothetical protein